MTPSLDTYIDKVRSLNINSSNLSDIDTAAIAFEFFRQDTDKEQVILAMATKKDKELLAMEKEKEKELLAMAKEKEKELLAMATKKEKELLVMEKEKELLALSMEKDKELATQKHENEKRCLVALRRRDLSAMSKRVVLEALLRDVVAAIPHNEDLKKKLQDCTLVSAAGIKLLLAGASSVKMTTVNQALLYDTFRVAAWKAIGISLDVPFPRSLNSEVVYGDLSYAIHSPSLNEVYLSSALGEKSDEYLFFQEAAERVNRKVELFNPEDAALSDRGA